LRHRKATFAGRESAYPGEQQAITPALCEWFRFLGAQDGRRKWGRGCDGAAIRFTRNRPDLTVIEQCHWQETLRRSDIDGARRANGTGAIAAFAGHLLIRRCFCHPGAVRGHVHIRHRHARSFAGGRNSPRRSHAAEKNSQRECESRDLFSKEASEHDPNLIRRNPADQGSPDRVKNS
jgi:hypothetical protein